MVPVVDIITNSIVYPIVTLNGTNGISVDASVIKSDISIFGYKKKREREREKERERERV